MMQTIILLEQIWLRQFYILLRLIDNQIIFQQNLQSWASAWRLPPLDLASGLNCRNRFIWLSSGPVHGLYPQYSILFIITGKHYSVSFFNSIEEHMPTLKACGGKLLKISHSWQILAHSLNGLMEKNWSAICSSMLLNHIHNWRIEGKWYEKDLYFHITLEIKNRLETVHNIAEFCNTHNNS